MTEIADIRIKLNKDAKPEIAMSLSEDMICPLCNENMQLPPNRTSYEVSDRVRCWHCMNIIKIISIRG